MVHMMLSIVNGVRHLDRQIEFTSFPCMQCLICVRRSKFDSHTSEMWSSHDRRIDGEVLIAALLPYDTAPQTTKRNSWRLLGDVLTKTTPLVTSNQVLHCSYLDYSHIPLVTYLLPTPPDHHRYPCHLNINISLPSLRRRIPPRSASAWPPFPFHHPVAVHSISLTYRVRFRGRRIRP